MGPGPTTTGEEAQKAKTPPGGGQRGIRVVEFKGGVRADFLAKGDRKGGGGDHKLQKKGGGWVPGGKKMLNQLRGERQKRGKGSAWGREPIRKPFMEKGGDERKTWKPRPSRNGEGPVGKPEKERSP